MVILGAKSDNTIHFCCIILLGNLFMLQTVYLKKCNYLAVMFRIYRIN